MLRRLPWIFVAISAVCTVADTFVNAAVQPLLSESSVAVHGWPCVTLAGLGSAVLGAIIVSRYPEHPVGWLLNLVGLTTSVSLLTEIYGAWVVEEGGPGSATVGHFSSWFSALLGGPLALTGLTLIFLLVPDGHVLTPRWRYVAYAVVVSLGLYCLGMLFIPPSEVSGRESTGPVQGLPALLTAVAASFITFALLASVTSMIIRLRRSTGETRRQLRWIAASAALVAVGLINLLVGTLLNGGRQTWASSLPLFVSYLLLITGISVAILRYRLYDIDLIISRAVLVTAATVFAACAYVALVVGVGELLGAGEERFWPSLIATAVVAMAFQPLRRRVVRFADRLAYGEQAAPYDALAAFSRRIGDSPAPERLLPAVAEAAGHAVSAVATSAQLDLPGAASRTVRWSQAASDASSRTAEVVIPVSDQGGDLGSITVSVPPGRDLRPQDLRLLRDIADQAALAFRNARLEAELSAHAEELNHRTQELAASRRRLIEAGDAERSRLAATIAREVLPKLAALRSDLVSSASAEVDVGQTSGFVERATEALESLRVLTQGIFPTLLSRAGLGPALSSYFARRQRPEALVIEESAADKRFPARVEAAAYFCCTEATASADDTLQIQLAVVDGCLAVDLCAAHLNMDRQAVIDRVEASGGRIEEAGGPAADGRRVRLLLPAGSPAG